MILNSTRKGTVMNRGFTSMFANDLNHLIVYLNVLLFVERKRALDIRRQEVSAAVLEAEAREVVEESGKRSICIWRGIISGRWFL